MNGMNGMNNMNVKRFAARTAREALAQVRQAFGEDAVVLSTKPCDDGIEVLAMAPEGIEQIEHLSAPRAAHRQPAIATPAPVRNAAPASVVPTSANSA